MIFKDLKDLVEHINNGLDSFCSTFQYKRKELLGKSRASSKNALFIYDNNGRDWAINSGGGTELQYHLFFKDNKIGIGIGFNTQYVPYANDKTPVEYMTPYAKSFILQPQLEKDLIEKGFKFIRGNSEQLKDLQNDKYILIGKEYNVSIEHNNFLINDNQFEELLTNIKGILFETYVKILSEIKLFTMENEKINDSIELLKSNKNLIFTGAPGTGKTYLAKTMALTMLFNKQQESELTNEEKEVFKLHYGFVQFHPSYDYTDFIEGLRPVKKEGEELGFELKNGTFKDFCKRAKQKRNTKDNFDEVYNQFIDDVTENDIVFKTPKHKKNFKVDINSNKTCVAIPSTDVGTRMSVTKEMIRNYMLYDEIRDWKPYTTSIGAYIKENYNFNKSTISTKDNLPYVFIIDEINRAEISKVFGELFFSIDPGYRGEKGKVKTQYANIQTEDTFFTDIDNDFFYIPENVYIIGTMNDIDRSVESFDFAMRRRFAWKEIKANDRIEMWDGNIDDYKEEASKKMYSLNKAIEEIEGLNSSYHIGPAYFLKLNNYSGDFDQLWNNHIQVLLNEYVRGMHDSEKHMTDLKEAYNTES